MNSTIILTINENNKDVLKSINSILNSNKKPTNLCIVASSANIDNKTSETVKALFKSCCDSEPYQENCTKNYTLSTKKIYDINFHYLIVNDITSKTLLEYGIEYLLEETDIFMTLSSGSEYRVDAIDTLINSLNDDEIGLSYSDYINNGKYNFLGSINYSMIYQSNNNRYNYDIREICFRKKYILNRQNPSDINSVMSIIKFLYSKSIIRHIPESLFTI
jgi:hypothetical protein